MKTKTAIELAGGRDALARLLGVETVTTYHWIRVLPPKHERYLRVARPGWFADMPVVSGPVAVQEAAARAA